MPFSSTLQISGLYKGEEQANLEYLEMFFTVRFYYSLQSMEVEDAPQIKQRYADVEWLGLFEPQFGGDDGKYERFELCPKGFVIHNVEVNEC